MTVRNMLENSSGRLHVEVMVKGENGESKMDLALLTVIEDTTIKPSVVYLYCAKKPVP